MRGDRGDISILNEAGLFPYSINAEKNRSKDGYDGNILALNWPGAEKLLKSHMKDRGASIQKKIINYIARIFVRVIGKSRVSQIGRIFINAGEVKINPKEL